MTGESRRRGLSGGGRVAPSLACFLAACASAGAPMPRSAPEPGSVQTASQGPGRIPVGPSAVASPKVGVAAGSETRGSARTLPPIPAAGGPLRISVRYPGRNQLVTPDSNFIFGSVGTGDARLEIDGNPVRVEPNGAFLAWLPVPAAERSDTARYRLVARVGELVADLAHPVRRPPAGAPPGAGRPWVDPSGVGLLPERWFRPGEEAMLEWVAERGAALRLEAGETSVPVRASGPERGTLDRYVVRVDLGLLRDAACRAGQCRRPVGASGGSRVGVRADTVRLKLVATSDGLERHHDISIPLALLDPADPRAVVLREAEDPVNGQSGVVVARPTPFGPYRWRLAPGTVAPVTGRLGDRIRIRMMGGLDAWVLAEDTEPTEPVRDTPFTWDARANATEESDRISFRVGLSSPAPASVTVTGERSVALTIFDVHGRSGRIAHGPGTGIVTASWTQLPGPAVRFDLDLDGPVWGYRLSLGSGEAAAYEGPAESGPLAPSPEGPAILRLDLRRAPAIDPSAPLSGRTIAVDPGHPGAGSYGPTGLFEGDANLAIARRLVELLEEAGARPVLARSDEGAVGLYERTRRARSEGAELFVSIHNNALPDGVRPFDRAGTSTYYYHPLAARFAAAVQRGMVGQMGLPDRGIVWGDLAVVREPWMPAILTEGAYIMLPEHEAALRTPEFQTWYARGVFEGIEAFLSSIARPEGG